MISMHKLALGVAVGVLLVVTIVQGEGSEAKPVLGSPQGDELTRGGHSQQYHYNSYPSADPYGYTYAGLSFDLSTGLFLALGAIVVLLALAAVCYPLLSKNSGGGDGWGWGAGSAYGSYRSMNLAGLSEKVLNALEKAYELYNKNK